jgi:hypothetical protein
MLLFPERKSVALARWKNGAVMPLSPSGWNVIVLGRWNPGILTPARVIEELFGLPPNTDVGIEVPMDVVAPLRITHNGLTIMVSFSALFVEVQASTYEGLAAALGVARRAMEMLPVTPLMAAGYNVRYQADNADGSLAALPKLLEHPLDAALEGGGCKTLRRSLTRTFAWEEGRVQWQVTHELPSTWEVHLNFDQSGSREQMLAWLAMPIDRIEGQVRKVLFELLGLTPEVVR